MEQVIWSDEDGSRGRRAWLLFVRGNEVIPFKGSSIPGVVVVRGTDYKKNGKWSHTTYRLEVADKIRHISGRDGWETGRFTEGLGAATRRNTPDTWVEVAECLGISVPGAMDFVRTTRPRTAGDLDAVEASLAQLEAESGIVADTETVTVSFGSPTNRQIGEGFWETPKVIPGYQAEIRLLDPELGWTQENVEVVGMRGMVVSVRHSAGMHGGYYAVAVAVVPGTECEIPPFVSQRQKDAAQSELPELLFTAFGGDAERIKQFMVKVARLDIAALDEHEVSCGRARKEAEVIRVSGDPDFFLGADPLVVWSYLFESGQPTTEASVGGSDSVMQEAFRKAGLIS